MHIYLFARSAHRHLDCYSACLGNGVRQYPLSDTIWVSGLSVGIKKWHLCHFILYSLLILLFSSEIGCNCDDNTNIFTFCIILCQEKFCIVFIESGIVNSNHNAVSSYIAAYTAVAVLHLCDISKSYDVSFFCFCNFIVVIVISVGIPL